MTRLDHNRALAQLAQKTDAHVNDIRRMTIWGNHSATQYPDLSHAEVRGKSGTSARRAEVDRRELHPDRAAARRCRHQGARRILGRLRRRPPRIDHVHTWVHGTGERDWVSMAVPSDGSYGIAAGVIYSYPVTVKNGDYQIVSGLADR